ncbi:flagellar protein FliS [Sporomusaceae bacterium BoRhaA]|uniref:flagellar export chaperone FliS n=1 Tax=Pelorhabdus rhamnosifermentans TaxID=2772457 RepID=UPI001C061DCA|nr:flagellar export chaperone FliS [Pelorhabdus rhamnosifermentans]MBU2699159.1 flagellar protein FliS [Pelorhabdus rhamnosifermentans]
MAVNPYEQYRRMQVETASQGKLILMLYEGAIKNLHLAQQCMESKNINGAHSSLMKAQRIIQELNITLNMDAGEIAQNLRDLYVYMLERLAKANMQKDRAIVSEVLELLAELKSGWDEIILKKSSRNAPVQVK